MKTTSEKRKSNIGVFIVPLLASVFWLLTPAAQGATHVTGTYSLGASPRVVGTINGNPVYGFIHAQRSHVVTWQSSQYNTSILLGYLDSQGRIFDAALSPNLWIDLVPNTTASPSNSYYSVTFNIQGSVHNELWVVTDVATVAVEAVRVTQPPGSAGSPLDLNVATGLLAISKLGTPTPCASLQFLRWSGAVWTCAAGGGGASDFPSITSGTNTLAAMVVGAGASLGWTSTGIVDATRIRNVDVATNSPSHGNLLIYDSNVSKYVPGDPLVQGLTAHDAAGSTTNPVAIGGFASAAAPSDVSTDVDIVRAWLLRNGSQVFNLATAGTLYDARQIRTLAFGTDSVAIGAAIPAGTNNIGDVDVLTLPALVAGTANIGDVDVLTLPALPAGSNNIGDVDVLTLPAITGTVTANAGTNLNTSALALDASVAGLSLAQGATTSGQKGVLLQGAVTTSAPSYTNANTNPLSLDTAGNLRVNVVAGGAGDGSILDGVSAAIKATVVDYTNSNPLTVRLTDTNGDYVAAGAGSQYTEDDASAANPIGSQAVARRRDSLATETTTDGDVTALNATGKGELYVKHVDAIPVTDNGGILTVDGTVNVGTLPALVAGTANIGDVDVLTLPALVAGSANIGDVDVLTLPALVAGSAKIGGVDLDSDATTGSAVPAVAQLVAGTDGTNARALKTDAGGELQVDVLTVPSLTIGTFPDNEPINVAQMNGATVTMGNGVAGTGVQRVAIASDNSAVSGMGVGATGAAPPANANFIGSLSSGATGGFLTGIPVCTEFFSVDIVTATTTLAITGVSGRHIYICAISLVTAAANNVGLLSGTGATCGTSTAGMTGGTTAAEGYNLAANGGIAQGSGLGAINRTETTGDSVCIVTSAATQLSGAISYAIY